MTEATTEIVEEVTEVTETVTEQDKAGAVEAQAKSDDKSTAEADKATAEASTDFVADPKKTDEENATALAEWEKSQSGDEKGKDDKPGLPDDWRETAAAGDADLLKELKRYGSLSGVAKALSEAKKALRSGKVQIEKPDASDEKAMAEWRKAQGIPNDPADYKLPDDITKRLTDEDKPVLSSFTEFAHSKDLPPQAVEAASEWYVNMMEAAAEKQSNDDKLASEDAETMLRKDWAHGEYKSNLVLGKRFLETIPGVGSDFAEARLPDGRRFGDIPEFVSWTADRGRDRFGDLAFSSSDGEHKHTARKEEIEKVRDTDFARYEEEGLDKEYRQILDLELKRTKK